MCCPNSVFSRKLLARGVNCLKGSGDACHHRRGDGPAWHTSFRLSRRQLVIMMAIRGIRPTSALGHRYVPKFEKLRRRHAWADTRTADFRWRAT
jgi:hypothetical protein